MKSIYNKMQHILEFKQKTCENFQNGRCSQQICDCRYYAEVWAYIANIIPESYRKLTLQDFNGMHNDSTVLSKSLVRKAREEIIKYCWKDIEPGEDYDHLSWSKRSIIDQRLISGSSLVIYGNPWTNIDSNNVASKFTRRRLGKTLIASIVMKEAIFQRMTKPDRYADSYEWADYTLFTNRLMENAKHGLHEEEVSYYEDADWLVLDNIDMKNDSGRQFRINVLDNYFANRMEKNKPTIFVFQDDISKIANLPMEFGVPMSEIINSRKTHHVALLEGK